MHSPAPAPGAAVFLTLHPVVAAASSFQPVVAGAFDLCLPLPLLCPIGNPLAVQPKEIGSPPSLKGSTHLDHTLGRKLFYSISPKTRLLASESCLNELLTASISKEGKGGHSPSRKTAKSGFCTLISQLGELNSFAFEGPPYGPRPSSMSS